MSSNIKILVVEDDFATSELFVAELNDLGYDMVFKAEGSISALDIIEKEKISLAFLDIALDGSPMDGISLGNEINKRSIETLIIFTTSHSDIHTVQRSHQVKHDNFLVKPVTSEQLFVAIQKALAGVSTEMSSDTFSQYISCPFSTAPNSVYVKATHNKYYFQLKIHDILYIEAQHKGINIVAVDKTYFTYVSLKEAIHQINNPSIIQVHRKFAVNKSHIFARSDNDIRLENGKAIPIGRIYEDGLDDSTVILRSRT